MSILFKNALVVDGSSALPFKANVAIEGSIIKSITTNDIKCDKEFDASNLILCPGFIDIHSHSELEALRDPSMAHKIQQGITFDVSGNCGIGVFPRKIDDKALYADILGHYSSWSWTDFNSYVDNLNVGINMAFLQSHSCLRNQAIKGNANRRASDSEIIKMCSLLEASLSQGALGLSTGLYYAPCLFADRKEIIELLKVVKRHDGLFAVHHRCEGNQIISSIEEVLSYVRETGVRLEISHLKAIGKKNQDKVDTILKMIDTLKSEGFDVAFDQYPYEYGSTSLFSLLPPDLLRLNQEDLLNTLAQTQTNKELRDKIVKKMQNPDNWDSITELCPFEDIRIVITESSKDYNNLNLIEASNKMGKDPYDTLFTLLSRERKCALMADITQSFESINKIFNHPLCIFGTDSLYAGENAHPRSANAAIHLLEEKCIKEGHSFESVIEKMTSKVAKRLNVKDRGLIKENYKADIVLFNPKTLKDNSDLSKPFEMCTGLEHVMVNGCFAMKNGLLTESRSGNIIRF